MRTLFLPCLLLLLGCGPAERLQPSSGTFGSEVRATSLAEPAYIYGLHDPGGEGNMGDHRGWIVFTVECGDAGRDFRAYSAAGYGVIVRLNHGYGSAGTLPPEREYGAFAERCAEYVARSPGAHYFIIGNETNLPREWPGNVDGRPETGEPITVARYVDGYARVHAAIKRRVPDARLIPAPVGTWAPPWPAQGLPQGFIDYWAAIIRTLGPTRIDGLALHAYSHGCDPALITSEQRMDPPYERVHYHFRVYRDLLAAIPAALRSRPVFITESNPNTECAEDGAPPRHTWPDRDTGWIRAAYAEIDEWNRREPQKIRALVLFRFENAVEGPFTYGLADRPQALADFRGAVSRGYRWRDAPASNDAEIVRAESQVPASLAPGEQRAVRVRVRNTGGTIWRAGDAFRLGAGAENTLLWSDFLCGGYARGALDARAFLCHDVPPGGTHDFRFSVRAGGAGGGALAVRMVRDGVEWFGAAATFPIGRDGGGHPYPACVCRAGINNYCHIAPRTAGCPMTMAGGYCDPDGDGGYGDADWVRGFTEYERWCRGG